MPDIIVSENIIANERLTIWKQDDFSDYVRGYPFIDLTGTNVSSIEYESGIEQIADNWGKTRKMFRITFPVSQKVESLEVQAFYKNNIARTFFFTSPVDGITYEMRFDTKTYRLERRHYDTYFAGVNLVEVF